MTFDKVRMCVCVWGGGGGGGGGGVGIHVQQHLLLGGGVYYSNNKSLKSVSPNTNSCCYRYCLETDKSFKLIFVSFCTIVMWRV